VSHPKMTAEERIQLDDRVRRLEWTDRLAYYGVASLMQVHADVAVAEITKELANTRTTLGHTEDAAVQWMERARKVESERGEARAEVERLRQELSRSEQSLAEALNYIHGPAHADGGEVEP